MRILNAGHRYSLKHLDGSGEEIVQFVKREGEGYPRNVGHCEGTTTQEVMRMTIDRAAYVNAQIPCWQTKVSIWLMSGIVWLYEHRAAKRHGRKAPGLYEAVFGETCAECGHVGCEGRCRPAAQAEEEPPDMGLVGESRIPWSSVEGGPKP